jgi:hypothetical protein
MCFANVISIKNQYVFFWVIPRRLIYNCRRFGTLYLFHLHRQKVRSDAVGAREGVFIRETCWTQENCNQ